MDTIIATLPGEIQEAIIDDLQDNREALLTCCFVSRRWLLHARLLLFPILKERGVYLNAHQVGQEFKQRITKLIDLLQSPHSTIARHLTILYITGPWHLSDPPNSTSACQWEGHIAIVLPLLTHIRKLYLDDLRWDDLSKNTKDAIGSLPRVDTVFWCDVKFTCITDIFSFPLQTFPQLRCISLQGAHADIINTFLTADDLIHISKLITTSLNFTQAEIFPFNNVLLLSATTPLSTLLLNPKVGNIHIGFGRYYYKPEDLTQLQNFLSAKGRGLRELKLEFGPNFISRLSHEHALAFSLRYNPCISTLKIIGDIKGWCTTGMIATVPPSSSVDVWLSPPPPSFDFAAVERSLLPTDDRPNGHILHFTYSNWHSFDPNDDALTFTKMIKQLFPALDRRGQLYIHY